jgi:hypothetical protein
MSSSFWFSSFSRFQQLELNPQGVELRDHQSAGDERVELPLKLRTVGFDLIQLLVDLLDDVEDGHFVLDLR